MRNNDQTLILFLPYFITTGQKFLAEIFAILEKLDHPELHEIFLKMDEKAPSKNEKQLESKSPAFQKELEQSIKIIPAKTLGMKPGKGTTINSLAPV